MSVPGAEFQLTFLRKIQRLFTEGDFVATYKFALLMALSDLAVVQGEDTDAELPLRLSDVAETFARYYWPQTLPYVSGPESSEADLLIQNNGKQAAVVNLLSHLRRQGVRSIDSASTHPEWQATLTKLTDTVLRMPITYLQNVGGEADCFLYDTPRSRRVPLVLKPGVAYCLRRFHGFIHELAKAGWVNHVRTNKRNQRIIGPVHDLEAFMFGTSRQVLGSIASILRPIQNGACFYCGGRIRESAEVDHFIPWSRYPQDTAHNFVLAHRSCNNDKRDFLAGARHLDHWMERNERYGYAIGNALADLGFVADNGASHEVARWAYRQGVDMGAHAWLAKGKMERLSQDCLALFR